MHQEALVVLARLLLDSSFLCVFPFIFGNFELKRDQDDFSGIFSTHNFSSEEGVKAGCACRDTV